MTHPRSPRPLPPALLRVALLLALALVAAACNRGGSEESADLRIVSGSENETLEPIIQRFAEEEGVTIAVDYRGSVDIMLGLEGAAAESDDGFPYDAVWPANSLWLDLGDTQDLVTDAESIIRSPIVFGVKRSVAEQLGWIGSDVRVADILEATESGDLRFMMTSASQSNSGASAYFGFLSAFAGSPEVLSSENLADPAVQEQVRRILGQVDRSSGSSGWLKDLFLREYDDFDAMVNYESVLIEANQELVEGGREPLYAVYPVDGLAISDSPLGYVDRGGDDEAREELFGRLQDHLLTPEVQAEALALGRRVGGVGLDVVDVDTEVFNPDWGIDVTRVISPIRYPEPEVVREALNLYQTSFRKPSYTVFVLDYSFSMEGAGREGLEAAMRTLLDQEEARRSLLQASPNDVNVVIPFDGAARPAFTAEGDDPAALSGLLDQIEQTELGSGTNIYDPVAEAFRVFDADTYEGSFPAVILMTDGEANVGSFASLEEQLAGLGITDVPVYGILFGAASEQQVTEITELTGGRVFDGTENLIGAFRTAKGYN